jgi:hypothetical protein
LPVSLACTSPWHSELLVLFFGLFPSSGILEARKHDVLESGSVSVHR